MARAYISQLTQYHRIQGSVMFHEAALHIADEARRIGLKDVHILQFPADGRQKFWTHRSSLGWIVKSAELHLVKPKEELLASFHDVPTSLHTLSQGTPPGGITAELVDVGSGSSAKDFRGKKVKGKMVLATGNANTVQNEAVVKRGAAGVITDTFAYEFPKVRESIDLPDAHCYQGMWPTSDNAKKIRFGFSLSKRQGQELRKYLSSGKKVVLKADVDAKLSPGKYDVLTATIRGSNILDEEVFLIAHLCHPKPGANDNASGSGLLMEIARTLVAMIRAGKLNKPKRTIRFIWVPETTGSIALLSNRPDLAKRFIAGVNLDMVGEDQEICKSTLHIGVTPDSLPSYLGDLAMVAMEDSAKQLDPLHQLGLPSNFRFARSSFSAGSDHAEFVDRTIGIPCVSFTQWPDKFYHTSMDTIDKVSEESLRRVGWTSAMIVLKLANADDRTASELATLTCSKGSARIAEASAKASQEIHGALDDSDDKDKLQKLAKLVKFHRGRINHIVKREQNAVGSVLRLGHSEETIGLIEALEEDLAAAGARGLSRIDRTVEMVERIVKRRIPPSRRRSKEQRDANALVPRRLFKGTLAWNLVPDSLGQEATDAYQRIERSDREFMSKTPELVNFIDGTRTVDEIAEALSSEYGPTDPAHVSRFLSDLRKLNLVSFGRDRLGLSKHPLRNEKRDIAL